MPIRETKASLLAQLRKEKGRARRLERDNTTLAHELRHARSAHHGTMTELDLARTALRRTERELETALKTISGLGDAISEHAAENERIKTSHAALERKENDNWNALTLQRSMNSGLREIVVYLTAILGTENGGLSFPQIFQRYEEVTQADGKKTKVRKKVAALLDEVCLLATPLISAIMKSGREKEITILRFYSENGSVLEVRCNASEDPDKIGEEMFGKDWKQRFKQVV